MTFRAPFLQFPSRYEFSFIAKDDVPYDLNQFMWQYHPSLQQATRWSNYHAINRNEKKSFLYVLAISVCHMHLTVCKLFLWGHCKIRLVGSTRQERALSSRPGVRKWQSRRARTILFTNPTRLTTA